MRKETTPVHPSFLEAWAKANAAGITDIRLATWTIQYGPDLDAEIDRLIQEALCEQPAPVPILGYACGFGDTSTGDSGKSGRE